MKYTVYNKDLWFPLKTTSVEVDVAMEFSSVGEEVEERSSAGGVWNTPEASRRNRQAGCRGGGQYVEG